MADILKDLYRLNIANTVQNLIKQSSRIKFNIFRSAMAQRDVDERVIDQYLMDIDAFLDTWEEYADSLEDAMKDSSPKPGVYILDYEDFKPIFYAKYDYASILPFADGIIQGIDSGKFKTAEDINDFFEYMVSKAFSGRADSTAGLLDETIDLCRGSRKEADRVAINLFTAVKRQDLFGPRDRKELYKASEKVLKYLCRNVNEHRGVADDRTPKIMIANINNVVEYITYSITAYVTRIYAIACYAEPFIKSSLMESAIVESTGGNIEYSMMRDTDEMTFRDIDKVVDTTNAALEFLSKIGIDIEPMKPYYNGLMRACNTNTESMLKNQFAKHLVANELREYISRQLSIELGRHPDQFTTYENISAINKKLSGMVYNKNHALATATTPCQEIVHVIRGTVPENETMKGYQDLSKDLMTFALGLMGEIATNVQTINNHRTYDNTSPGNVNKSFSFRNNATELVKTLTDLYKEIAVATLSKARDIEMHLNVIRNTQDAKIADSLTIKVPGDSKTDVNMNDDMMCGIPDTTRLPINIDNLYAIPSMEYVIMYDEYVHDILGDAAYYEAGGAEISLIDKIRKWLEGIKKAITRWSNATRFKAAVSWVNSHKEQLNKMTFNQQMTVKAYRKDIKIGHIKTFIEKINAFTADNAKDQDSVKKFIEGLYNDGQTNWGKYFGVGAEGEKTKELNNEQQALQYRNAIIFGNVVNDAGADDAAKFTPTKTLQTSRAIHDELQIWMDNVGRSSDTYNEMIKRCDEIDAAIDGLKNKISSMRQNAQQAANNTTTKRDAAPSMSGNGGGSSVNEAAGNDQPTTDIGAQATAPTQDFTSTLLTGIETVVANLCINTFQAIKQSIIEQYQYIQEAYSKGNKAQ